MAVWTLDTPDGPRLARGGIDTGPVELVDPGLSVDVLLGPGGPGLADVAALPAVGPVPPGARLRAPVGGQPVWAAGVTYQRSRDARREESTTPDHYDLVYTAARPELFVKALPGTVRGPDQAVGIRSDSAWNVPEPELALVLDHAGAIVGYTIGNDMSSRSIEGENPLYLPQAKVYRGSCALGPALVPVAEAAQPVDIRITMTVTRAGAVWYDDSVGVDRMRRTPAELASWLCRGQDLPTGAVLLTGTALVPPERFTLQAGDVIEISLSGLGTLTNTVEIVDVGR